MAKRHTHMYHKIQQKYGTGLWACALPNCTHYLPLNVADMIFGRESLCTNCMAVMFLDEEKLKNNEPICANCNLAKQGILIETAEDDTVEDYERELKMKKFRSKSVKEEVVEEDQIEVIEPEEVITHVCGCPALEGGDCTCNE